MPGNDYYLNAYASKKKSNLCAIKRLLRYLAGLGVHLKDVGAEEVKGYYDWLKSENYSEKTIKDTIWKTRSFYRYLMKKKVVKKCPFGDGTRFDATVKKFSAGEKKLWNGFVKYETQRGIVNPKKNASFFTPFFQYLKRNNMDLLKFSEKNVNDFETWLLNIKKEEDGSIHYTRITVMTIVSVLRRFYNYLKSAGKVRTNPFLRKVTKKKVKKPKAGRLKPAIPRKEQFLLAEFLETRITEGYRDKYGMKKQVSKLFEYLQEYGLSLGEMKVKQAQEYQAWLLESGTNEGKKYSSGSIQNFCKGALRFYDFLKKKGVVYANPFQEIRRKRVAKRLPRNILKEKEMIKLLSTLEHFTEVEGLRNQKTKYKVHVIAELLYATGIRAGEAAKIKEEDIDFLRGTIKVIDVKDGHEKLVFLNEYAKNILKIYVREMKDLVLSETNDRRYIFGVKAVRLLMVVNEELRKVTKKLKLPVTTSHGFRHAVGYHFLRAGCDLRYIQEILGHKSIHNTEIYTKVDKEDLQRILDEFHPRKWRKVKK